MLNWRLQLNNYCTTLFPPIYHSEKIHFKYLSYFKPSSEDEDDNEDQGGIADRKRKREKLTRAQLNKRKRRNIASHEESKKKDEKDLLKSLDSLPKVIKGIEAEEKRLEDMKIIRKVIMISSNKSSRINILDEFLHPSLFS